MKRIQGFICGFLAAVVLLISVPALAETIQATFNVMNIKINGELKGKIGDNYTLSNGDSVPFSIVYKGTTYLPLRKLSELFSKDLTLDGAASTVNITDRSTMWKEGISEKEGQPMPENAVTRKQFARWLVKSFELSDDGTRYDLPDVGKSDEHYVDICIAMQRKYLSLYTDGRYGPEDEVTRYQYMYIMLFNVYKFDSLVLEQFQPVTKEVVKDMYGEYDDDYLRGIAAALDLGLLSLYEDGTIRLHDPLKMDLTPNPDLKSYIQK